MTSPAGRRNPCQGNDKECICLHTHTPRLPPSRPVRCWLPAFFIWMFTHAHKHKHSHAFGKKNVHTTCLDWNPVAGIEARHWRGPVISQLTERMAAGRDQGKCACVCAYLCWGVFTERHDRGWMVSWLKSTNKTLVRFPCQCEVNLFKFTINRQKRNCELAAFKWLERINY